MVERGSRTLARGLAVLRTLGESPDGATVAQISVSTGLDRAVLYRLLDTLAGDGFVVRDESTRLFHLGVALIELGARAGRSMEVTRVASGSMRALMDVVGEAVCLAVRDRDEVVVVDRVEPADLFVRIGYAVGFRHGLAVGAHGRALLAHLPVDDGLPPLRGGQRADILARGYASSVDELETGASGVAAPIFDAARRPVASLGIVAPSVRLGDVDGIGPQVARAATEISARLGYRV